MKKQDDIRTLLGRIRKLQEENHKINLTSTEEVRNLVEQKQRENLIENIKGKKLLKEEDFQEVTPDEQREEENKFKETVSKLVKFEKMKVYRQNVEWGGELVREKIRWVFSLNETNGCYISIQNEDMLQLTLDVLETLKKLKGYYDVWSDEWGGRLTGTTTGTEAAQAPGAEETSAPTPEEGGGF